MLMMMSMLSGMMSMLSFLSWNLIQVLLFFLVFFLFSCMSDYMYSSMKFGLFGGDLMSFLLIVLSIWITILMFSGGRGEELKSGGGEFKLLCLLILFFLWLSFIFIDLLMFYIFFELVLIPMFLMISAFGYQPERLESGVYMLFYTMFGSLPLLVGILQIKGYCGSLNFLYLVEMKSESEVWGVLLISAFLIKLPMYGFHIWLPKAHVEAPVSGSMILAGVLLKLGGYGLYRVLLVSDYSVFFQSLLISFGLFGGFVSSLSCFRQLDMKKLIAYSSVVHMGLFLGGLMTMSYLGMMGGIIMSIGHGLCSSGLFYLVNVIYERMYSRSLLLVKGVISFNPSLMLWLFLLMAGNSAAPPFLNIFGEIYLGMSLVQWSLSLSVMLLLMFFFPVGYCMYFFSVLSHGKAMNNVFKSVNVYEYQVMGLHFFPMLLCIFKLELFCNW